MSERSEQNDLPEGLEKFKRAGPWRIPLFVPPKRCGRQFRLDRPATGAKSSDVRGGILMGRELATADLPGTSEIAKVLRPENHRSIKAPRLTKF